MALRDSKEEIQLIVGDEQARLRLHNLLTSGGLSTHPWKSGPEFLAAFANEHPGCLVVDAALPDMDGLQLHRELRRRGAGIPTILISADGNVGTAVEAMREGAFDYLLEPLDPDSLLHTVRQAIHHDTVCRHERARIDDIRSKLFSLTAREKEVLQLVARGFTNKAAAHELGLTERSIEVHRSRVMSKMGARSLADLIKSLTRLEIHDEQQSGAPVCD